MDLPGLTEVGNFLYDNYDANCANITKLTLDWALAISEYIIGGKKTYLELIHGKNPHCDSKNLKYKISEKNSPIDNIRNYFILIWCKSYDGDIISFIFGTTIPYKYIFNHIENVMLAHKTYIDIIINCSRNDAKNIIKHYTDMPYANCTIQFSIGCIHGKNCDTKLYDKFIELCEYNNVFTEIFVCKKGVLKKLVNDLTNNLEIDNLAILADLLRSSQAFTNVKVNDIIKQINEIILPPAKTV